MEIPKTIKNGVHTIEVELVPDLFDWHKDLGSSWAVKNKIKLDSNLSQNRIEETLLHEILHHVWFQMGLDQSGVSEKEEYIVNTLANGLYPILKENGWWE